MKKFFSVLLTLALLVGMTQPITVNAAVKYNLTDYQAILDKLNTQYGTETRFATPEELNKIGLKPQKINISPVEFEKELLIAIDENAKVNLEARATWLKRQQTQINERSQGLERSIIPLTTSYSYSHTKSVTGAYVTLNAQVSNVGAWRFTSVTNVFTSNDQSLPYPWFSATAYNYQYTDSYRTCSIALAGFTIDRYGVVIDPSATRYVDFWAGSNM